ncbi:hypothetical protein B0H34DRAFT_473008 [Crassisporium funariophilum]|nr:hypothetical protein B0H34DRAFT_473008 [Crassisporium funariophilum]
MPSNMMNDLDLHRYPDPSHPAIKSRESRLFTLHRPPLAITSQRFSLSSDGGTARLSPSAIMRPPPVLKCTCVSFLGLRRRAEGWQMRRLREMQWQMLPWNSAGHGQEMKTSMKLISRTT